MDRRKFIRDSMAVAATALLTKIASAGELVPATDRPSDKTLKSKKMNIVVLTGSPRRNGNTNYLADRFIAGAQENGHSVFRFDCAAHKVAGCMACNHCGMDGECVLKDDFETVRPHLVAADMVAFVTPMYYFGFSAQLKSVLDRFYAINGRMKGAPKKTAFLMAYADAAEREAQPMIQHYRTLVGYLGWEDKGMVIAPGVWTAGAIKNTRYGDEAYQLGKSV